MSGLSLRQAAFSLVGVALGELDILTKVTVPFPMKVLAPSRAVEDEAA